MSLNFTPGPNLARHCAVIVAAPPRLRAGQHSPLTQGNPAMIPDLFSLADVLAVFAAHSPVWLADSLNLAVIPALAVRLAAVLAAEGLRTYVDDADATRTIHPATGDRVSLASLAGRVASTVAELAETAAINSRGRGNTRARNTVEALESRPRGLASYLRDVTIATRNRLPDATPDELAAMPSTEERRRAPTADRGDYFRERRRTLATTAVDEGGRIVRHWADGLPPGRHALPDLWEGWNDAIARAAKLGPRHGARRLGRNQFYEILADHGRVVSGGARRRFLVVGTDDT